MTVINFAAINDGVYAIDLKNITSISTKISERMPNKGDLVIVEITPTPDAWNPHFANFSDLPTEAKEYLNSRLFHCIESSDGKSFVFIRKSQVVSIVNSGSATYPATPEDEFCVIFRDINRMTFRGTNYEEVADKFDFY